MFVNVYPYYGKVGMPYMPGQILPPTTFAPQPFQPN